MEFEDMQAIWDEHNQETLYAINRATLDKRIKEKTGGITSALEKFEWIFIGIPFFLAIFYLVNGIIDDNLEAQLLEIAVMIVMGIFVVWLRDRRIKSEVQFDDTVMGDIDRALWQIDYKTRQLYLHYIWYWVPLYITLLLSLGFTWRGLAFLGLLSVAMLVSMFGTWVEINKELQPKKADLEALRDLLNVSEKTQ